MLWLIIIGGLAILIGLGIAVASSHGDGELLFLGSMMAILGGAMVGFLATLLVWLCLYPFTGPVHHVYRSDLVNLQDASSTTGSFFLGIGNLNGDLSFSYYVTENGYAVPQTVDSAYNNVRVYQDSDTPYVIETVATSHFWTGSPFNGASTPPEFDFHVPKGTIKQDYSLDAK